MDLLYYFKEGNYLRYSNCFTKVANYYGLELGERGEFLKRIAFRALCRLGIIDVNYKKTYLYWTTSPSFFYQRNDGNYVLIGPTFLTQQVTMSKPPVSFEPIGSRPSFDFKYHEISFYPSVPTYRKDMVRSLAKEFNIEMLNNIQKKLLTLIDLTEKNGRLPIKIVTEQVFQEYQPTQTYSFDAGKWNAYEHTVYANGIYRKLIDFRPPVDFICYTRNGQRKIAIPQSAEWTQFLGRILLDLEIKAKYNQSLKLLKFDNKERFPTLISRALIAGNYFDVLFNDGLAVLQEVENEFVATLNQKMANLEVLRE